MVMIFTNIIISVLLEIFNEFSFPLKNRSLTTTLPTYMNAYLLTVFLICWIMYYGNGLSYRDFFLKYETRDDYYEDYYLRKIPKLRTSPDKIKQFFINHLSWFPVDDLEGKQNSRCCSLRYHNRRNCEIDTYPPKPRETETTLPSCGNHTEKMKDKIKNKIHNFTESHHLHANWSSIKSKSSASVHKFEDYVKKKHITEKLKNATHPLRYRGSPHHKNHSCGELLGDKELGPSIRIHPKSSHVEVIRTSTTSTTEIFLPNFHFSYPRKIKVVIDLKPTEKVERNIDERSYLANLEGDIGNSTNVLETAGEMAYDLAGRVTSLWHCVVGSHRIPDTRDVKFYLYTRRNVIQPELLKINFTMIHQKIKGNRTHVDLDCVDIAPDEIPEFERISDENREIIKSNFLNLKAPTKILIHGYTGSYKDSRMAKIKDAYLRSGRYNVIQVDWESLAAPPCYIRVTHHAKFVGETIGDFLNGLYLIGLNMSLLHLVGFSLGAQVAGFAGNNSTLVPVCRITGLDPALPLFLHTEPSGHLDRLDAKFVDVIHTCGGILAMLDPLGHVDFYPNGGTRQPGCEFSNLKCSHSRAPQYFAESVVSQRKFTGQLCLTWEEFIGGDCNNATNTSYMGEPCSRSSAIGKYYLLTKSKQPFVL